MSTDEPAPVTERRGWLLSSLRPPPRCAQQPAMSVSTTLYSPILAADGRMKLAHCCNACSKQFPHKGGQSTKNLSTHYANNHGALWWAYQEKARTGAVDDVIENVDVSVVSSTDSVLHSPPHKRAAAASASQQSSGSGSQPTPKRHKQQTLVQSLVQSANPEVLQLMAVAFATNHIAYNVASSNTFRAFLDGVRRSTVPLPARRGLKEEVSKLADDMRARVLQRLQDNRAPVASALDGWTNVRQTKVNNIVLLSRSAAFYWCSLPNALQKNNAQWLFDAVVPKCEELEAAGLRFAAFVADNEAVMGALYDRLRQRYPFLVRVPCAAHTIQLVVRQALSSKGWTGVVEHAEGVLRGFASNKEWRQKLLQTQQGESKHYVLVKPNDTRWNSMLAACERLQKLQPFIDLVSRQTLEFWVQLKALIAFLQPFKAATDVVQRDNATLLDVFVQFQTLSKHVNALEDASVRREMQQALVKHWEAHVNMEATVACAMVSLNTDLSSFDAAMRNAAGRFIAAFGTSYLSFFKIAAPENLEGKLLAQLGQFKAQREPFATLAGDVVKTQAALGTKWSALDVWALYDDVELATVAQVLLTMPASEAAVERSFSAQGAVHTKLRNRLHDTSVQQEMFVAFNHGALSRQSRDAEWDGCIKLDEAFMQVDTEPDDSDAEEPDVDEDKEQKEEEEPVASSSFFPSSASAAAAAAAVPHRTQSEINSDNRAFLEEYIAEHRVTLATRWNGERTMHLEAAALGRNTGGYSTPQLIAQIKLILSAAKI